MISTTIFHQRLLLLSQHQICFLNNQETFKSCDDKRFTNISHFNYHSFKMEYQLNSMHLITFLIMLTREYFDDIPKN